MLFNSYVFLFLFLPVVLLGYYALGGISEGLYSRVFLVLASLFFYLWWNPIYLTLLLSSIIVNFYLSIGIKRIENHKKLLLIVGIIWNLSLLGYFKYADFFLENVSLLISKELPLLNLILPLAISFFSLQQIAFLVDSYYRLTDESKLSDYSLFVCFFPQLIAGPIVHHKEIMPQFKKKGASLFNHRNFSFGLFVFSVGLFKKVVIADSISPWVDAGYLAASNLNMVEAWLVSIGYFFQLYFDFSGYSDMAVGLGLMFNVQLPINFKSPYKATSMVDFWRRWHITLTQFIGTYLFKPLVKTKFVASSNFIYPMFIRVFVMSIVGIWHGSGWNFFLFGLMHGLALVVNHVWRRYSLPMPSTLGWLLTMICWIFSIVFLRAETFNDAVLIYQAMLMADGSWVGAPLNASLTQLQFLPAAPFTICLSILFAGLIAICLLQKTALEQEAVFKPNTKYFILTAFCLMSSILLMDKVVEFIYFQF